MAGENVIEALADRLQAEGRFSELEANLAHFDPLDLAGDERESWYRLRGVCAYQAGDRALAFQRFEEGLAACPNSALIAFSMGQEHEHRGQLEPMLHKFARAVFPAVPAPHALAEARYAYLWDRLDEARRFVRPVIGACLEMKILDPTFLHTRGLPPFAQVWSYLAAFSLLQGDFAELEEVTRRVMDECSSVDGPALAGQLAQLRPGDTAALSRDLKESLTQDEEAHLPLGYARLRLAIHEARLLPDPNLAAAVLDAVSFDSKDFPWLEDMRTLARAELSARSGELARENAMRTLFLARQPLLFEPDHMVAFGLLEYQETLKADYQRARSSTG